MTTHKNPPPPTSTSIPSRTIYRLGLLSSAIATRPDAFRRATLALHFTRALALFGLGDGASACEWCHCWGVWPAFADALGGGEVRSAMITVLYDTVVYCFAGDGRMDGWMGGWRCAAHRWVACVDAVPCAVCADLQPADVDAGCEGVRLAAFVWD
jgi:hypothetical protein